MSTTMTCLSTIETVVPTIRRVMEQKEVNRGTPDVTDFRGVILAVNYDDDDMLAIPKWNMLNSRSLEIDSKL